MKSSSSCGAGGRAAAAGESIIAAESALRLLLARVFGEAAYAAECRQRAFLRPVTLPSWRAATSRSCPDAWAAWTASSLQLGDFHSAVLRREGRGCSSDDGLQSTERAKRPGSRPRPARKGLLQSAASTSRQLRHWAGTRRGKVAEARQLPKAAGAPYRFNKLRRSLAPFFLPVIKRAKSCSELSHAQTTSAGSKRARELAWVPRKFPVRHF